MSPKLRIFHSGAASENVVRLRTLAECLGIPAQLVNLQAPGALTRTVKELGPEGLEGCVLDVESLKQRRVQDEWLEVRDLLEKGSATVLLLVTGDDDLTHRFMRILTDGVVDGVSRVSSATKVRFSGQGRVVTAELAGQTYERHVGDSLTLRLREEAGAEILMELGDAPAFVHFRCGRTGMYVWSTPRVFDMRRPLVAEKEFEETSDEYIPGIIFLRATFRKRCWHNPESGAGIVIDDPLLQPRLWLD